MLVACRLAGLSALGAHYAGVKWRAMRADAGVRNALAPCGNASRFPFALRAGHMQPGRIMYPPDPLRRRRSAE